jgi:hypothetical protein
MIISACHLTSVYNKQAMLAIRKAKASKAVTGGEPYAY